MHKRAPVLRPRKGGPTPDALKSSSTAFKASSSRGAGSRSNGEKSSNVLPFIFGILFFIIVGCVIYENRDPNVSGNKLLASEIYSLTKSVHVDKTMMKAPSSELNHTNEQKKQKPKRVATTTDAQSDEEPTHHLIFSTDCSSFQHWQSYLLFHSALKVHQPGTVTRIASGCNDADSEKTKAWHEEHITQVMGPQFKLHLTPHFSGVKDADGNVVGDYKFFNKPFGLKHWLEYAEGLDLVKNENDIVILIDPDMVLLRPITRDFSVARDVVIAKVHQRERKYKVEHGAPFAQKYGLGSQWRTFDLDAIAGEDSPAKDVSHSDGNTFYPVGPPYIGTVRDMHSIALKWTEFVPRVHKQYPHLLAEMYAFCIAAAHLGLKHQLVDSLMISNVSCGGEGWPMIDEITTDKVDSLCTYASQPDHGKFPVPSVIHFCQRYAIGDWFFGKRKMVKDFFECESPLMEFPPEDVIEKSLFKHIFNDKEKELTQVQARREGFMVCGILGALNDAATFFKEHSCNGDASYAKTVNLNK
mmetsp:Transcript_17211/g.19652  ORF Transcript_17211/g.19652 Transcript_17211/m.19652 type:complete len:527 (+) Transcript_17211:223-1803(+)